MANRAICTLRRSRIEKLRTVQPLLGQSKHDRRCGILASRLMVPLRLQSGLRFEADHRLLPSSAVTRLPMFYDSDRPESDLQFNDPSNQSSSHSMRDSSRSSHVHGRTLVTPCPATEAEVHTPALIGTRRRHEEGCDTDRCALLKLWSTCALGRYRQERLSSRPQKWGLPLPLTSP